MHNSNFNTQDNQSLLIKKFELVKHKQEKQAINYYKRFDGSTVNFINAAAAGASIGGALGLAKGSLEQDGDTEITPEDRLMRGVTNTGVGAALGTAAGLVGGRAVNDGVVPGVEESLGSQIRRKRAAQRAGIGNNKIIRNVKDVASIGKEDLNATGNILSKPIQAIKSFIPGTDEHIDKQIDKLDATNNRLSRIENAEAQTAERQQTRLEIAQEQAKAEEALRKQQASVKARQLAERKAIVQAGPLENPLGYLKAKPLEDLAQLRQAPVATVQQSLQNLARGAQKARKLIPFSYMSEDIVNFAAPDYINGLKYGGIAGAAGGSILGAANSIADQKSNDEQRLSNISNIPDPYMRLRQYEIYNSDASRLGKTVSNLSSTAGNALGNAALGAAAGGLLAGGGVLAYKGLRDPNTYKNIMYGAPKENRFVRGIGTMLTGK